MLNIEEITSSETPQQQQPRRRSYRPWGCCLAALVIKKRKITPLFSGRVRFSYFSIRLIRLNNITISASSNCFIPSTAF